MVLLVAPAATAQQQDLQLAREYYSQGDYEKATELYSKLINNDRLFHAVYPDYLKTLLAQRNYKEAEKLVKKTMKRYPGNLNFEVDMGLVYQASGDKAAAEKQFSKLLEGVKPEEVIVLASVFMQNDLFDLAERAYLRGRQLSGDPSSYSQPLIALYSYRQKIEKLIPEVLNLLQTNESELGYVQSRLQNSLQEEKTPTNWRMN
ncbi:hypothetical protein GCM10028895_35090 [Pontibacter rugosus]